jgi:Flp pilus assembly pilin Flp
MNIRPLSAFRLRLRLLLNDGSGQDMIEYALLAAAGFLAAAAVLPTGFTAPISHIMSNVKSILVANGG